MAQNEGVFGAVKQFIPGFNNSEEHHTKTTSEEHEVHDSDAASQPQQGGLLSYIPGFGGGASAAAAHEVDADAGANTEGVDAPRTTRSGAVYNKAQDETDEPYGGDGRTGDFDTTNTRSNVGDAHVAKPPSSQADPSSQAGADYQAHTGGQTKAQAPHESHVEENEFAANPGSGYGGSTAADYHPGHHSGATNTANEARKDYAPHSEGRESDAARFAPQSNTVGAGGSTGTPSDFNSSGGLDTPSEQSYHAHNQGHASGDDNGVRGAPVEGENIKGYAVSAPVGTGDVNNLSAAGDPSGQVSGAHTEYGPIDTDDRNRATGRGTVGRTVGDGNSSFANIKRNIDNGTEHVVSHQSSSRVEHRSTTQL